MENTASVALSSQMVLSQMMDIIANNMANIATPAFKSESLTFRESLEKAGNEESLSLVIGGSTFSNFSEGPMSSTGGTFDVAIHGDGFFSVETSEGTRYSRLGRFQLDSKSMLVTGSGESILDSGGRPIRIPQQDGEITIAGDGTISTHSGPVARIAVYDFEDLQALQKVGDGLYKTDQTAKLNRDAKVVQGMVEDSNVNGVLEMTYLIDVSRAYQAAQKLIEAEFDRQKQAIDNIPAVS
jgi:flagellar basal-body rod protein FlgF